MGMNILVIPLGLLIFAFAGLAAIHIILMKRQVKEFKAPTLEQLRFGDENAKKMGKSIFNEPLQEFERQVNKFVREFNKDNKFVHKVSAVGYIGAAVVTFFSLYSIL